MRRCPGPSRLVRHRTCLAAASLVLVACGSSAAQTGSSSSSPSTSTSASTPSPGSSGPPAACGPAAARTLIANHRARVYVRGGQAYGCTPAGRTQVALGGRTSCLRGPLAGPFALAGVRVAYGLARCGVDTGRSAVVVRRLRDGQVLVDRPATATPVGVESYVRVTAVVLAGNGAVGWITQAGSIVRHQRLTEVHVAGPSGARILATGPAIAPGVLKLNGTQLRWRDGGRWHTARLS